MATDMLLYMDGQVTLVGDRQMTLGAQAVDIWAHIHDTRWNQ